MENIISEIKTTADKVAKKSTQLVELSKAKLNIANTKSSINSNFRILGEMLYLSQKDEGSDMDSALFEETIAKIDELYMQLADFNDIAAGLMNKKLCPECRHSNESNATFCSRCGYRFADSE